MRRLLALLPLVLLSGVSCSPYESTGTNTYYGFPIGVADAPAPPHYVFSDMPAYRTVPGTSVLLVPGSDYDVFQYGSVYYLANDGYWYQSRSYNGPFVNVDVRRVPRSVLTVPTRYWKHRPYVGRWDRNGREISRERSRYR